MSEAREKRNARIRNWYTDLRKKKNVSENDAIDAIYKSAENVLWCLTRDTIRLIATYKDYGNTKAQRALSPKF